VISVSLGVPIQFVHHLACRSYTGDVLSDREQRPYCGKFYDQLEAGSFCDIVVTVNFDTDFPGCTVSFNVDGNDFGKAADLRCEQVYPCIAFYGCYYKETVWMGAEDNGVLVKAAR